MKLKFLLILALVSTGWAQINNGGGSGPTTGGATQGAAQNTWQIQTAPCGSNANCTQINGDAQAKLDATSNSTTTITCPDCAFVQADVGKTEWMTAQGTGVSQYSFGALICPVSTIASVTNATTIVVNAACTANATGTGIFVWGHKDGATLHAMTPGCSTIYWPCNTSALIDQSFLTVAPSCATSGTTLATGIPQPSLYGCSSNTQWFITPDVNWASATGTAGSGGGPVLIGSGLTQLWEMGIWGTGTTPASNANCANANGKTVVAMNPAGGAMYFVNLSGICPGQAGLVGVELNSLDEQWKEGGAQNVGITALEVNSKGVITESLDNHNIGPDNGTSTEAVGENITSTGQLTELGTFFNACVTVNGTLTSRNAHFVATNTSGGAPCQGAISVNNGGLWQSDSDFVNQDTVSGGATSVGVFINSGGKVITRNTIFGASGGSNVAISNGGLLVDKGGNTRTGTSAIQADFTIVSGDQIPTGACTGTATSTSTLGIQLGGPTSACTSTTVNSGLTMSRSGTILSLAVNCGTTGSTAGSGVFTVNKTTNGTTTQLTSTCTIGNVGTTCKDFTHQPAFVAGDILSVQFTTGAAETLANCKVSVIAW